VKIKSKIKIIEKKLGRSGAWGLAYRHKNLVEIDSRLSGKRRLKVLCHELAHKSFPKATEKEISRAEQIIGNSLWEQNYRRVDQ
jgi:hypothetical protein